MTTRSIKKEISGRRAMTMPELLITSVIAVMFFVSVLGVFVVAKMMYERSLRGQDLQRDIDAVMATMVKGIKENGTKTGMRSAASFTINGVPSIEFIGLDGVTRKYYTGAGGIIYDSPKQAPNPQVIYSTPPESVITLRFWQPDITNHETVAIYLGVTRKVSSGSVSGSLQTYVNLRNFQ